MFGALTSDSKEILILQRGPEHRAPTPWQIPCTTTLFLRLTPQHIFDLRSHPRSWQLSQFSFNGDFPARHFTFDKKISKQAKGGKKILYLANSLLSLLAVSIPTQNLLLFLQVKPVLAGYRAAPGHPSRWMNHSHWEPGSSQLLVPHSSWGFGIPAET